MPERHAAVLAFFLAAGHAALVPPRFGFTYVQTSLLWVAAGYDLARNDKDRAYDLFACIVSAPVGAVAWCEGLGCDAWFKAAGGHVWYDAIIPASMVAYVGACAVLVDPKGGKAA